MRCEAFLKEWSVNNSCHHPLSRAAMEHLAVCPHCRTETQRLEELDKVLRRALTQHADLARPRAVAVASAIVAATATVSDDGLRSKTDAHTLNRLTASTFERSNARTLERLNASRSTPLRFVAPVATNLARWAVAAALIAAATLMGRGQPFQATPTYADMTATVAAAAPGTPAAISWARPAATPVPR